MSLESCTPFGSLASNTTTVIASKAAYLQHVTINAGSAAGTITLYDNAATAAGTILGVFQAVVNTTTTVSFNMPIICLNGIVAVMATASGATGNGGYTLL